MLPALRKINLEIISQSRIGIIGATGSGKSTLLDLILGLISAQKGQISLMGNRSMKQTQVLEKNVGYVPQDIFILNTTLAENIAFGIPSDQIDLKLLRKVIKLSNLDDLVSNLDDGIRTVVEKEAVLSGGQIQRIGMPELSIRVPQC